MLAPTGRAAYNIEGNEIYSALRLAIHACQSLKSYKPLDSSRLNTLRCQVGGFKLIFIDGISMAGNTVFNVQNNRVKKKVVVCSLEVSLSLLLGIYSNSNQL